MQDSLVDPKTVDVSSRVESLGLRHNFGKRASQRTIATDEDEEAAAQEKASQLLQAAVLEEEEQRRQHGKCWSRMLCLCRRPRHCMIRRTGCTVGFL